MPGFVNRVTLQGYLEIDKIETVSLDGLDVPVLHGSIMADPAFGMRHQVLIADRPAVAVLEMLRQFQTFPEQKFFSIGDTVSDFLIAEGKPFVSIEGNLIQGTNGGTVVNVSWITFLTAPYGLLKQIQSDRRLHEMVNTWRALSPEAKDELYCQFRKYRTAFCDLSVTERAA